MSANNNILPFLPTTTQAFTVIREDGFLYVDKTDLVYDLTHGADNVVFYSRPRRFGKTLLVSTLEAYFKGQKDYFEGLKIMDLEKEWKQYEVLRFDLSGCITVQELTSRLSTILCEYEQKYGVSKIADTVGDRLHVLIATASRGDRNVVLLVDEYDYALQHTLFRGEIHEQVKDVYRNFFAVFKSQSRYIRFVFITGITKFTQLSLFSVLNNISIIGHLEEYQALCGFTKEEVQTTLRPYVLRRAEKLQLTEKETYDAIQNRYDGYHFCENGIDIFNPYSLVNSLNKLYFDDFWETSGSSQMLMDAVDHIGWDGTDFDDIVIEKRKLRNSDVNLTNLPLLMYQSGYLTIKDADEDYYFLGIPNVEVRYAISNQIVPRLVGKIEKIVTSNITLIKRNLRQRKIDDAMEALKALVADTPYSQDNTAKGMEEKFQFLVKNAMYLAGCYVDEEKRMINGRADLVARHDTCILIIELKMKNNGGLSAAEQQIRINNYAAPYMAQSKPIYAVALEFDTEARCMTQYSVTPVK